MAEPLPRFTYHPDPLATGAVVASDATCLCCDRARGFIYAAAPYAVEELVESICPWCIADGSAVAKFDATFVQDIEGDVPQAVQDEVYQRTPGYECWQGEAWLTHCDDACEFHGDATPADLRTLSADDEKRFVADNDWLDWPALKQAYQPKGDVGLYRFVCRHCGITRLGVDMS